MTSRRSRSFLVLCMHAARRMDRGAISSCRSVDTEGLVQGLFESMQRDPSTPVNFCEDALTGTVHTTALGERHNLGDLPRLPRHRRNRLVPRRLRSRRSARLHLLVDPFTGASTAMLASLLWACRRRDGSLGPTRDAYTKSSPIGTMGRGGFAY